MVNNPDPDPLLEGMHSFLDQLAVSQDRWPVVRTGEREPIADSQRLAVKMRDGFACVWCTSTRDLVLDHILPWSAGGSNHSSNLRTLCWTCNEQRSNRRYAGDLAPRPTVAGACTRCRPPEEDTWTDLVRTWCFQCKAPARSSVTAHEVRMPPESDRILADQARQREAQARADAAAREVPGEEPTP